MPEENTKTPDEWAQALFPAKSSRRWEHDVAVQMHGWPQHAHETGAPIQLTAADYSGAIAAVAAGEPYAPALSEYAPHALRAAEQVKQPPPIKHYSMPPSAAKHKEWTK